MITSLRTAFFIAVFTGVVVGAAAGRLRNMLSDPDESAFPAMLYGGIGAAFVFGAVVAFDGVVRFLLWEHGPTSLGWMLGFTILAVVLFALVFVLYK
jgi:hypothetical protein